MTAPNHSTATKPLPQLQRDHELAMYLGEAIQKASEAKAEVVLLLNQMNQHGMAESFRRGVGDAITQASTCVFEPMINPGPIAKLSA